MSFFNICNTQWKLAMKKKGGFIFFFFMVTLSTLSLCFSCLRATKRDIVDVPCYIAQTFNNKNDFFWNIFLYILPFLAAIPFAFSSYEEKETGIDYYVNIRMGKQQNICAKALVAFGMPFFICIITLLLNLFACYVIFPDNYNYFGSDLFDENCLDYIWGNTVTVSAKYTGVFLKNIFMEHPVIYDLILIFIVAVYAGMIGTVDYLFGFFVRKNMILIFLPGFLIQTLGKQATYLAERFHVYLNLDITSYMGLNFQYGRGLPVLFAIFFILCVLIAVTFVLAVYKENRKAGH